MSVEFLAARLAEFADLPALTGIDGQPPMARSAEKSGLGATGWKPSGWAAAPAWPIAAGSMPRPWPCFWRCAAPAVQIVAPCVPGPTEDTGPADVPETFAAAALADVVIRPDMKGGPICDLRAGRKRGHALMEWLRRAVRPG